MASPPSSPRAVSSPSRGWQASAALTAVRDLLALRERYQRLVRDIGGTRTSILAVDVLLERVFVSVRDLATTTGSTPPTARATIDRLVSLGILRPWGRSRATQLWVVEDLWATVYGRSSGRPLHA